MGELDRYSANNMFFYLIRDLIEEEQIQNMLKLYFVVKGSLEIKIHDRIFQAKRDDIILVNEGMRFSARTNNPDTIVGVAGIGNQAILEVSPKEIPYFLCNSTLQENAKAEKRFRDMRVVFQKLILEKKKASGASICLIKSYLYQLSKRINSKYEYDI